MSSVFFQRGKESLKNNKEKQYRSAWAKASILKPAYYCSELNLSLFQCPVSCICLSCMACLLHILEYQQSQREPWCKCPRLCSDVCLEKITASFPDSVKKVPFIIKSPSDLQSHVLHKLRCVIPLFSLNNEGFNLLPVTT